MTFYLKRLVYILFIMTSFNSAANESSEVARVLDSLHQFAAESDAENYFSLFTDDAIFIGTDVNEYWTINEFKSYALPFFNKGKGWVYVSKERDIRFSGAGDVAWFHEVLDSKSYGTSRGTGVLVLTTGGQWKIAQYHLTFPLPNDLAAEITDRIKTFEAEKK